jgi:glycosyltransferase involved in cell wall biosynthesis
MKDQNCLVTVLMPSYNSALFLDKSIKSILNQTFKNFEFIIINDGSTDNSEEIILNYVRGNDTIIYHRNDSNIGLAASLNKGIKMAKGKYIARMDADDISLPDRIESQVDFMEKNPHIGILGTAIRNYGTSNYKYIFPSESEMLKCNLLFNVCFAHPSVIIRKEVMIFNNIYYNEELRQYSEEYDLWSRLIDFTQYSNLDKVKLLYHVPLVAQSITKKDESDKRINNSINIRKRLLTKIGVHFSKEELALHNSIANISSGTEAELSSLRDSYEWLQKILLEQNYYDKNALHRVIAQKWFLLNYKKCNSWRELHFFMDKNLTWESKSSIIDWCKFIVRFLFINKKKVTKKYLMLTCFTI